MFKSIFTIILSTFYTALIAEVTITIKDKCDPSASILQTTLSLDGSPSLGRYTIEALELSSMSYIGNESGINSIADTPTGHQAIRVLSDSEMYAYGWCYHLNGQELSVMPDQAFPKAGDQVIWFYAYSHLKDNNWIKMCEPSNLENSSWLCQD